MGLQNLNALEELLNSVGLGENKEREERKMKQLKNNNNIGNNIRLKGLTKDTEHVHMQE